MGSQACLQVVKTLTLGGHAAQQLRRREAFSVLLCQPVEARDVLLPIDFGTGPDARRTSAETRRRAVEWRGGSPDSTRA